MKNSEPNKIVSKLWKRNEKLTARNINTLTTPEHEVKQFFKEQEELKKDLEAITNVVGAVEVMSKMSLIKLVALQSKLRFMPHHTFYIQFAKAADYLLNPNK